MSFRSKLIAFALVLLPVEFREEFGQQIQSDAENHGNIWVATFDTALKGIELYFESFMRDVIFAVRILRKTPVFTGAAILTLAIAISVNATVFGAINAVLFKPLPFTQPNRLAFICNGNRNTEYAKCGEPLLAPFKPLIYDADPSLMKIAAYRYYHVLSDDPSQRASLLFLVVSTNFFDVLGIRPEVGRFLTRKDLGATGIVPVVISDRLWRSSYAANPHILGKIISFGDLANETTAGISRVKFIIAGVAPPLVIPSPDDRTLGPERADIFSPGGFSSPFIDVSVGNGDDINVAFARLQNGVSLVSAQAELDRLTHYGSIKSYYPMGSTKPAFVRPDIDMIPFRTWYASLDNSKLLLSIAFAATIVILLIACANLVNLLLSRGASRRGELALRSALGATQRRLVRQLVAEAAVLTVASAAFGTSLSFVELWLLKALAPNILPRVREIPIDGMQIAVVGTITVGVTILAGILPAFLINRKGLSLNLKSIGRGRDEGTANMLRSSLVIVEVALAFVVLVSSALLVRSFWGITHADMGFTLRNVYAFKTAMLPLQYSLDPTLRSERAQRVLTHLTSLPGVDAAAVASTVPFNEAKGNFSSPTIIAAGRGQTTQFISCSIVTSQYFNVLDVSIVRGRVFDGNEDPKSAPVAVITQRLAKLLGFSDPVGKYVHLYTPSLNPQMPTTLFSKNVSARVIGVVRDTAPFKEDEPLAYVSYSQFPTPLNSFQFIIRSRSPQVLLQKEVDTSLTSVDPALGIQNFYSLNEELDKRIAPQLTSAFLLGALALIAVLLALGGIYATVSYTTARRIHEFGIRKAIGAQPLDIVWLVLRGAVIYTVIGIALGIVLTTFSTRAIVDLLVQTSPFDPLVFACALSIIFCITILAASIPAIRAMRIDPAVALRYE